MLVFWGCSSQKNNATNRALQNLSARYNYIYNANVLLETYQENLRETYKDDFDNILPVYIAPEPIDFLSSEANPISVPELEEINKKAQAIISDKSLSNYLDEAYTFLGKTNFYQGNYFTAIEFFDYLTRAYKKDKNVVLTALNWKSRSLMQLKNYTAATKIVDTVTLTLDSVKRQKADAFATLAQLNIYAKDYKKAINYLERAIKETNKIESRTRWPFILAQLYEYEKDYNPSLRYYTMVENSNAPFEMYFNAKLSKLRIYDIQKDQGTNRKKQLLSLLKDDKNIDYTDKIYYEVAQDYYDDKAYIKAEEYYKLSAANSTSNLYQKGISYLKIADLNFKDLRNYAKAKLYYDSATITLPKKYPNYETVAKKAKNLEYLTKRLDIIAEQDTLQMLANLPLQERERKIESMFAEKSANKTANSKTTKNKIDKQQTISTFYFANNTVVAQGLTDFKKKWGNRPFEDNWRQSVKPAALIAQQTQNTTAKNAGDSLLNDVSTKDSVAIYKEKLPLTSEKIEQSDQKIVDAYYEIANFYQQELNDQEEAIKTYELLLSRFPENNHLAAIYYSLYLDYLKPDKEKSDYYKNLIFEKFPESIYANTILDPNYSAKKNNLDAQINSIYNEVFTKYEQKDFASVVNQATEINQLYPANNLKAQFDYLKAIAIGRTNSVSFLLAAFDEIITKYPEDKLITPLVKDHLTYINAHLNSFKIRKIALVDFDPTEPRFIGQQENVASNLPAQENKPTTETNKPEAAVVKEVLPIKLVTEKQIPAAVVTAPTKSEAVEKDAEPRKTETKIAPVIDNSTKPVLLDNLFSKAESSLYYYVIAISDASASVSSSRFGIGQFNRGNFTGAGLSHQLLELDEDQLIYVGDFETLKDVKNYNESINQQLLRIMKIPAQSYKTFYISTENLAKIKNRETLNRYIEFFKINY